jgi:D-alanine--poly(phosphoribitol) ligase subunit 1
MDIIERIDRAGQDYPDKIAHVSGDRTLTYGELSKKSDAIAGYLAETFPGDYSPVVIAGHKEPEMLVGFLGAVKSGRPYIPIDVSIPAKRAARIVQNSGPVTVLRPTQIAVLANQHWSARARRVDLDDPYYVIFTSGSTGEPKGVVITLRCLTTFLDWMLQEQKFGHCCETFLNQAPFSFDLSVMDIYLSLATAGTLFSLEKGHIANLKSLYLALRKSEVTTWVSTPTFAQMCLVERGFQQAMLPQLRRFLFCGEILSPETASQLLDRFPRAEVWNSYGPTEATVACASVQISRETLTLYSPLPIGAPMPGSKIFIANKKLQPIAPGERGEIIVAGTNVSPGYLARSDLTEAAFFRLGGLQAYRTGDWGRLKNGLLFFDGRIDSQVKVNGYRIELEDVEENLRALPSVSDAVVLPVIKKGIAQSLAAFVVLATRGLEGDFAMANHLRAQLAERLPAYMLPGRILFRDAFPMTPNGKTDRRKLAESVE